MQNVMRTELQAIKKQNDTLTMYVSRNQLETERRDKSHQRLEEKILHLESAQTKLDRVLSSVNGHCSGVSENFSMQQHQVQEMQTKLMLIEGKIEESKRETQEDFQAKIARSASEARMYMDALDQKYKRHEKRMATIETMIQSHLHEQANLHDSHHQSQDHLHEKVACLEAMGLSVGREGGAVPDVDIESHPAIASLESRFAELVASTKRLEAQSRDVDAKLSEHQGRIDFFHNTASAHQQTQSDVLDQQIKHGNLEAQIAELRKQVQDEAAEMARLAKFERLESRLDEQMTQHEELRTHVLFGGLTLPPGAEDGMEGYHPSTAVASHEVSARMDDLERAVKRQMDGVQAKADRHEQVIADHARRHGESTKALGEIRSKQEDPRGPERGSPAREAHGSQDDLRQQLEKKISRLEAGLRSDIQKLNESHSSQGRLEKVEGVVAKLPQHIDGMQQAVEEARRTQQEMRQAMDDARRTQQEKLAAFADDLRGRIESVEKTLEERGASSSPHAARPDTDHPPEASSLEPAPAIRALQTEIGKFEGRMDALEMDYADARKEVFEADDREADVLRGYHETLKETIGRLQQVGEEQPILRDRIARLESNGVSASASSHASLSNSEAAPVVRALQTEIGKFEGRMDVLERDYADARTEVFAADDREADVLRGYHETLKETIGRLQQVCEEQPSLRDRIARLESDGVSTSASGHASPSDSEREEFRKMSQSIEADRQDEHEAHARVLRRIEDICQKFSHLGDAMGEGEEQHVAAFHDARDPGTLHNASESV